MLYNIIIHFIFNFTFLRFLLMINQKKKNEPNRILTRITRYLYSTTTHILIIQLCMAFIIY